MNYKPHEFSPQALNSEQLAALKASEARRAREEALKRLIVIVGVAVIGIAIAAHFVGQWTRAAQHTATVTRQSEELSQFFPEQIGVYTRVAIVPTNTRAAMADANYYADVRDSQTWAGIGLRYRDDAASFMDVVSSRGENETLRGWPANLNTTGTHQGNFLTQYTVLVGGAVIVNVSAGGPPSEAARRVRAIMQGLPLDEIAAWAQAQSAARSEQ